MDDFNDYVFEGYLGTVGLYYGWDPFDPFVNIGGKLVAVYSHRSDDYGYMGVQVEDVDGNLVPGFHREGFANSLELVEWLNSLPGNEHTFSLPVLKALASTEGVEDDQ